MFTAVQIVATMHASGKQFINLEQTRHAKPQCSLLSWLMSILLKLRLGTSSHFLSQNIAQKEPNKKMPLMVAYAITQLAKLALEASWLCVGHIAQFQLYGADVVSLVLDVCVNE